MTTNVFRFSALALSIVSVLSSASALADDVAADAITSIEKITVMGEKTERSLKDTTSSVSVISAEQLANGQYLSVSNAIAQVSNVVVLSGSVPDIRGVSGNGAATGFNSFTGGAKARVSTIVDGVIEPFVADLTGDTGLWDIAQIEVFRGPQSTSNGRNSIAGSLFIKTNDPSFDWDGAARLGYRNQSNFVDSAIMLTGPILNDQLAFRITAQNVDGDTYNKGLNHETNPATYDLNELKTQRFRSKFLWQPNQNDDLQIMYSYAFNKETGDTGRKYFEGQDPWAYIPVFQRDMTTESGTHSVKVDYQLDNSSSVDLIVAIMDYDWGFDSYEPLPESQSSVRMDDDSTMIDAKYNFGLDAPGLKGFIGFAHFQRTQDFGSQGATVYSGDDRSDSDAIYGEVSVDVGVQYRVIAGGRVEKEKQRRNFAMQSRTGVVGDKLNTDKTIVLPKLVLQYLYSDNTTISASARRGYNSAGGALSRDNEYYYYDEESVNTYELTLRSSLNNGNVNISANAFYNNYDGYQSSNKQRRITNIDKVITQGVELEIYTMLGSDLQLKGGLGLLTSDIKAADVTFGDIIGNELNSAPSITANIGATYWLNDEFSLALSSNYVDDYYADFENTKERIAGDYMLTRINVDYENEHWRVSAYINNVFDKKALTVNEPPGWYPQGYASVVDPRTLGMSITYYF
ncbi:TonB-dependent receptor [Pseudoalteromonas tunicata]|uniref:TonB-dependent receptor n=1 Tax=Pseudoalteromonas tunicata TaxID=314281 RepID=UPI00273E1021|nr:TonB-dependent receptor [Pseudoalteromonas tunicata]MDP5214692.1 TonB-dependent receptor [Pseudoalteromonas tunicata]